MLVPGDDKRERSDTRLDAVRDTTAHQCRLVEAPIPIQSRMSEMHELGEKILNRNVGKGRLFHVLVLVGDAVTMAPRAQRACQLSSLELSITCR